MKFLHVAGLSSLPSASRGEQDESKEGSDGVVSKYKEWMPGMIDLRGEIIRAYVSRKCTFSESTGRIRPSTCT